MKVKTLLAAIIATTTVHKIVGPPSWNGEKYSEEIAKFSNSVAENIMKQNGECMEEHIALFIPGEPG